MKREISDVLRLYSASLLSGWFALLFFYIAELILIYWFSGKLRPARFLYYFGAYMVIGTVFGLGTGTAHALLTRLIKGRFTLKPEPLSLALNVSGLLCFLSFVVLNAHYMPLSPITSAKSLALNFAIAGSFVFLLPLFYVLAGRTTPFPAPYRTMSVCSSAAIAFVAFQALISKILGGGEYTTSISAGLTFLSLSAGSIAALADLSILNILAGTKRGGSRASLSKKVLLGKCVVAASAFAIIASGWFANDNERPVAESRGMSAATPGAESPNVIFIVLDTVRQDRLSVYGCERETSPNIARFAEKSWVFDAYSTATWTLPSHASIVTGLYPTENGTGLDSHNYIEQRNETIAEILTENGYSTAAVVANHLALGPSSGFSQGFGYYYAEPRETDPVFPLVAHSFLRKFLPRSSASRILPC